MKDPKVEGRRWLDQASRDFDAAGKINEDGLWWIACFQSQQAAEKAVKAFLYSSGERVVLGHSISELVKQAAEKNSAFNDLVTAANQLDRFYIPTRYPNALPGGIPAETYTEADAKQAIELAGEIMRLVKSLLS